jgi:hypothetical protein
MPGPTNGAGSLISIENQNPDYIGIDLPSKMGIDRFGMHTTNWGIIAPTLVSKVQIVHPQIAVGWTGQKFAAEVALKAVKDNIDQLGFYPGLIKDIAQEMGECKLGYVVSFLKEDGLSCYRMANDAANFTDPVFG